MTCTELLSSSVSRNVLLIVTRLVIHLVLAPWNFAMNSSLCVEPNLASATESSISSFRPWSCFGVMKFTIMTPPSALRIAKICSELLVYGTRYEGSWLVVDVTWNVFFLEELEM